MYDALIASEAIIGPDDDGVDASGLNREVILGPTAGGVFGRLGINPSTVGGRRKYAYACRDWTECRFHLGGALGAAVCQRLIELDWVALPATGRAVEVSPSGYRLLQDVFGIVLDGR